MLLARRLVADIGRLTGAPGFVLMQVGVGPRRGCRVADGSVETSGAGVEHAATLQRSWFGSRGDRMRECDFWVSLEYRICSEFAAMPERRLQYLWCDGFFPSLYLLDDPRPRITGKAWICNGPRQEEWDFAFLLPRPARSLEEIAWASLLPPENVTRWMALDEDRRYIEIEPAVAVPDLAEPGGVTERGS